MLYSAGTGMAMIAGKEKRKRSCEIGLSLRRSVCCFSAGMFISDSCYSFSKTYLMSKLSRASNVTFSHLLRTAKNAYGRTR